MFISKKSFSYNSFEKFHNEKHLGASHDDCVISKSVIIPGGIISGCRFVSDCRSRGRKFDPAWSNTFVEIDHEIIFSHSPPFR